MIHRHSFRTLLPGLFVGVFIVVLVASLVAPASAAPLAAKKTPSQAYHDEWRALWEDHITWTRVVIMGILDELPGTSVYIDRLLQNPGEMEAALTPYYGEQATVLSDLIRDHLVIAAELLTAANTGDTAGAEAAHALWYANAHDIAVQMNAMNPEFWPLAEPEQMWVEHLDATLDEALDHLNGDFAGEVAAYDLVHQLALEMADFISDGVMRQFPKMFK